MKYTCCLLVALVLICCCSYAQPVVKPYAEVKREQERKQYNKDFIEANKYNRNLPGKQYTGASGDDEARKLADQFKRNKGQMPDSDKEYWRLKALTQVNQEQQRQENNKRYEEFLKAQAARVQYLQEKERIRLEIEENRIKERNKMLESGITTAEAYNLAWFMIPGSSLKRSPQRQQFIADKMLWVPESFKLFSLSREVEDYARLKKLAEGFVYAGYSHVKAMQYLAIRFPEKEKETSLGMLNGLRYFYGGTYEVITGSQYYNSSREQKVEMEELFLNLYEKYPAEALSVCITYDGNNAAADLFKSETDEQNKIMLAEMCLRIPDRSVEGIKRKIVYLNYLKSLPGFFEVKSPAYWKELGKIVEGGAAEVIDILSGTPQRLHNISFEKGKLDKIEVNESLKKEWLPFLRRLAEAGDASALNALGVLAVSGNLRKMNKEDAVDYWAKAAEGGSLFGYLNLLKANKAGFKNIPSPDKLQRDFVAMVSKANGEELMEMALSIMYNEHGDLKADIWKIGKVLAEGARDMGVKRAQQYVHMFN